MSDMVGRVGEGGGAGLHVLAGLSASADGGLGVHRLPCTHPVRVDTGAWPSVHVLPAASCASQGHTPCVTMPLTCIRVAHRRLLGPGRPGRPACDGSMGGWAAQARAVNLWRASKIAQPKLCVHHSSAPDVATTGLCQTGLGGWGRVAGRPACACRLPDSSSSGLGVCIACHAHTVCGLTRLHGP